MKKTLLTTTILLFSILFTYGQVEFPTSNTGKINYSNIVKVDGVKSEQIQNAFRVFSETTASFVRKNSNKRFPKIETYYERDFIVRNISNNSSIVRIVNYYNARNSLCLRLLVMEYDLIIRSKDGRYKYELTNFRYTNYNRNSQKPQQLYGLSDKGLCNSQNTLEKMLECKRGKKSMKKYYNYLHNDNLKLLEEIKKGIMDNIEKEEMW